MYTFWLVIKDLFWFVLGKDGRDTDVSGIDVLRALPSRPVSHLIAATEKPVLLANPVRTTKVVPESEPDVVTMPLITSDTKPAVAAPDAGSRRS